MRCKECGSTNIDIDRQQTPKYSWGKGFLGSLVFGAPGAAAGVGGKTKTTTKYHCKACGTIGDFSWVIMDPDTESDIDIALQYNDTAKLKSYKRKYRNIEWTPPVKPVPTYSEPILPQATPQSIEPQEEFEIKHGVLKKYHGKSYSVEIPNGVIGIGDEAFAYCKSILSDHARTAKPSLAWCA